MPPQHDAQPEENVKSFGDMKVGDKMIMQVPAMVRVLSIGPSDIAPGMRHYTYEVIDVEKRGESDCGIAVPVQIEKP